MRESTPLRQAVQRGQSVQIGIRITKYEFELLRIHINQAEQAAGLMPGTISPAAYIRSVLLQHMAAQRDAEPPPLKRTPVHTVKRTPVTREKP